VETALARIEKVNPELNAVILPLYERARLAAASPKLPDGPFRGEVGGDPGPGRGVREDRPQDRSRRRGALHVAAYARENLLLRVAAQLEEQQPWHDRRPPIDA
jgi:Asp-tRNA(Asn)/Glu-tRNA(Gln) amidotransferase A subunit family amidase